LSEVTLIVLSPSGVVRHDGEKWELVAGDVTVTCGHDVVEL
jgi:quercetin dioxygenase-like cupin family protein